MTSECLVCGGPVVITPNLFDETEDRWDCLRCGTWGTISRAKANTEREKPADES